MGLSVRIKLRTEDRQAELVQAALMLAAQKSPAEVTTADLAQMIGITQGGVFKHFKSKEVIWLTVLDWVHATLLKKLTNVAHRYPSDARMALRSVFMAHIAFVERYPGVPRLIFQELQHAKSTLLQEKVQLLMTDYRTLLVGLLAQAHCEGVIAKDVDMKAAVVLFIGAVQGLVMQSLMTGGMTGIKRQAKSIFEIYEAGLRGSPMTTLRERV